MKNRQHIDAPALLPICRDIRQLESDKLSGSDNASGPTDSRIVGYQHDVSTDCCQDPSRCGRIVLGDVREDFCKVALRLGGVANPHGSTMDVCSAKNASIPPSGTNSPRSACAKPFRIFSSISVSRSTYSPMASLASSDWSVA